MPTGAQQRALESEVAGFTLSERSGHRLNRASKGGIYEYTPEPPCNYGREKEFLELSNPT
jgi:hypothetical protein